VQRVSGRRYRDYVTEQILAAPSRAWAARHQER
jgi:hypothetical protein